LPVDGEHSDLQAQQVLIKLYSTGMVRTRADAETMRDEIAGKGWTGEKDLRCLYRAVLALLGDERAIPTLPTIKERVVAEVALEVLRRGYIGDSPCTCPRLQVTRKAKPRSDCPVHGTGGIGLVEVGGGIH
jgi:hypothetical protein